MPRVDYDAIAHVYDEPDRDHDVDAGLVAFVEASGLASSDVHVLDVGCGTGKQLGADRARYPAMALVGVDRFGAMLRIARSAWPTVAWAQADGAALPFAAATFHYATSQYSHAHIRNHTRLLRELFRVLKPGGRFVMTNIDPWAMPDWLIYRVFPEARALDYQDFVPIEGWLSLMRAAGFQNLQTRHTDTSRPEHLRDFLAFASRRHRASQLMAIPDDAYCLGLGHLARTISSTPEEALVVRSQCVVVTVSGDKAPARAR
jgi:ubiquinone/menaquinone biosynthesis C-methylase UbiE